MKKTAVVSLASLAFLLVASAVAVRLRGVFTEISHVLLVGFGLLLVSGLTVLLSGRNIVINISVMTISAVAMGCFIRAWYMFRGFDNSFPVMALVSLAEVLYIGIFFFLLRIPLLRRSKKSRIALWVIYGLMSAAGYFFVMVKTHTTYVSTFGFYMLFELAFLFAMCLEVGSAEELIRNLAISTLSVFVVAAVTIAIVVLVVMSGGDGCSCDCDDCVDCGGGDCGGGGKKKQKKHNR